MPNSTIKTEPSSVLRPQSTIPNPWDLKNPVTLIKKEMRALIIVWFKKTAGEFREREQSIQSDSYNFPFYTNPQSGLNDDHGRNKSF